MRYPEFCYIGQKIISGPSCLPRRAKTGTRRPSRRLLAALSHVGYSRDLVCAVLGGRWEGAGGGRVSALGAYTLPFHWPKRAGSEYGWSEVHSVGMISK